MDAERTSNSSESLPAQQKTEVESKSLSEDRFSVISSKISDSIDTLNDVLSNTSPKYDPDSADDIYSCDPNDPCAKVKNTFSIKDNDKLGNLPCDSCEFIEPVQQIDDYYCFGCCKRNRPSYGISEFWLISVPKEKNDLEKLNRVTKRFSQNYKFHTPMLQVGVLNTLIEHIEHLKSLDKFAREVSEHLTNTLKIELGNDSGFLEENLLIKDMTPATYMTRFKWDRFKYPTYVQISTIADTIFNYLDNINECLKQKLNLLERITADIKPYEQRETESFKVRYLGDIVKKEHFIQDSKFLTTILVVVPIQKRKDWENTYASLSAMVVPGSSTKIFKNDTEYLYTVILPLKDVDEFKKNAREYNFSVRQYKYSEENQAAEKKHYQNLAIAKTKTKAELLTWTKLMFGEAFEAWIHVMTLRVFVESVVRYGLPVNYEPMLLIPLKSKTKLKNILHKLYNNIEPALSVGDIENIPGGLASYYDVDEYYPYVFFSVDLGFIYTEKK